MKIETLRKSHKKHLFIGVILICLIGSVVVFTTTRAKYRFTESIPFVRGTINYKMPDLNVVGIYVKDNSTTYNQVSKVPESGYILNETESYCGQSNGSGSITKDSGVILTYENGSMTFNGVKKPGTKCNLYFDKIKDNVLLAKYTKVGERENYQTLTSDNSGKVYSLEDDDGISYYFAGAVTNNWVKFAGFYWRIVRFNGDGSVRLIYSGTTAATTGIGTQIETSKFNSSSGNNMYVGYRYTSGDVHGTGTASTIQGVVDTWYKTNIVDKGYSGKVESKAGFCGDRDSYTDTNGTTTGGGTGGTTTYYGASIRFYKGGSAVTSPTPTLKCKNSSDLYTVNGTKKGNESLTYPVGLITADEVSVAGVIAGTTNTNYYLYTGEKYWTMSPSYYDNSGGYARVFRVDTDGGLFTNINVSYALGVRPVINLKADTLFSDGDGTSTSPYEVI